MSYTLSISGHAASHKEEAEVLADAADFAEAIDADGSFSFVGQHMQISSGPAMDGVARARAAVTAYNESADADDQVEAEETEPAAAEETTQ